MKVVALISGGKDSCYNMLQCVADGHEVVALANLQPSEDEIDSYMYQSVGHDALDLYAKAMNLPLFRQHIKGKPINKEFQYIPTDGDEVEDLFTLLQKIKESMKIEGVSVGAIFSDYQRLRVQNVCDRLQLKMLAYLWHRNQEELLQEMINCKIKSIVIKVAALGGKQVSKSIQEITSSTCQDSNETISSPKKLMTVSSAENLKISNHQNTEQNSVSGPNDIKYLRRYKYDVTGLDPAKHLGKTLEEIFPHMVEMNQKYGLNICGEGGEFETFTLDCPLFKKQLLVMEQETIIHSNDAFAPVAYLKLKNVKLKDKDCDVNLTQFECIQDIPVNLPMPVNAS